ncbi:MAG: hypothetical protein EBR01_08135 [Proteobacteria bacterium]|nr:hypothetical protein [Pseudomonadota bacterium]NBY19987.1 hypothetical protein [bacterium]
MKNFIKTFVFGFMCAIMAVPSPIEAGSHGPAKSYYGPYRSVRPVCRVGCVAPVRRTVRAVGRTAAGVVRGVGRVTRGAVRAVGRAAVLPFRVARAAVRGTGRLLFGRRRCCRI